MAGIAADKSPTAVTGAGQSRVATAAGFDVRTVMDGAALLASTANVIMQLARPAVGYGVLQSSVPEAQVMRHPLRRLRTTITYLSVAFLGTADERAYYRRQVNRSHARVRSTASSPVRYSAFDPELQLWVAACLYRGLMDVRMLLHGPADEALADAIYRECRRLATTLQVPEAIWPADRASFERYWTSALAQVRIDPPVRDYLDRLMALDYLPGPVSAVLGPVSRFFTAGFLPPLFRAEMRLSWTDRDQRLFAAVMSLVAAVNWVLPGPVARFPFNACLHDLRVRRLVAANLGARSVPGSADRGQPPRRTGWRLSAVAVVGRPLIWILQRSRKPGGATCWHALRQPRAMRSACCTMPSCWHSTGPRPAPTHWQPSPLKNAARPSACARCWCFPGSE